MPLPLEIRNVLFATDFFENSRLSLDYAIAFAHSFQAKLVLVHAIVLEAPAMEAELLSHRPSASRQEAEERLNSLAAGARRTGLDVETLLEEGVPHEVILKAAKTYRSDLLVLGVHGMHKGLGHLLVGSNTEKILLSAACPVLTVGARAMAGLDLEVRARKVIYVSDFSLEAASAAPYALLLAEKLKLPVDVCQLVPDVVEGRPALFRQLADEYCETMRRFVPEPAYSDWCLSQFHLDHGMTLNQILDRAATEPAALIVLGVHSKTWLGRHLHATLGYQLLAKARCPVLTFRQPQAN